MIDYRSFSDPVKKALGLLGPPPSAPTDDATLAASGQAVEMPQHDPPFDWLPAQQVVNPPATLDIQRTIRGVNFETGAVDGDGSPDATGAVQYRQPLGAANMGPDTTTGADEPSSTYNDPSDGGTQSQPLPAYTDGGDGDGSGAGSTPAAGSQIPYSSAGERPSPVAAPPADDPGGAQFAAQDAYSTPVAPPSDPVADATRRVSPDTSPTSPTSTQVPVWDDNGQVVGYRQAPAPEQRQVQQRLSDGTGQVSSTPGEQDYVPSPPNRLEQAGAALEDHLMSAGGAVPIGNRIRAINDQAARDQGRSGDFRAMFDAANDPAWRDQNPELASEYDDLQTQYAMVVGGMVGGGGEAPRPKPGSAPQTVEVLQQRLQQARSIVDRLIGSGDAERLAMAQENRAAIESALADAQNARRSLEPRIRSDIGAPESAIPPSEQAVENRMDQVRPRGQGPTAPEDLSGPVSIPVNPGERLNVEAGPASYGPGLLDQVNTGAGNAIRGAMTGGVVAGATDPGSPQGEDESDADYATRRAREMAQRIGTGALVSGAAFAAGGALLPRGSAGAFQMAGPQGQGGLPGMPPAAQRAVQTAQQRTANMAAKGVTRPSAWDWIKAGGYSGIYSPATAVSSAIGGATELALAAPKEAVRALVEGRPIATRASARAQVGAVVEGIQGLGRVLVGDAGGSAAASGGSQGTAGLSGRVANPVGHFAARVLERPGEVLTEAPDAVFRPMFRSQGMEREASRVAAEMKLPPSQRGGYAQQLIADAEAVRSGQLPSLPETQRVLDAGEKYADQLGYKGQPGAFGQWLGKIGQRNDAVGVAAQFLMPFPAMATRMSAAAIKTTPGAALLPSVRKMYPSRFDMVYDQALGAVAATGVAYWAMNGGVTGSGPSDQGQRAEMVAQGWQPNSVLIAGHYIPNRVMGRFQPMLDTAGELHDALTYGKEGRTAPQIATELVTRGKKITTDQIGLSGLADLNDLLDQGFASQFPGFAARSMVRYLPYGGVLRAAAASLDSSPRKADKWQEGTPLPAIGENLKAAVPIWRQTLPAAQDVLGRPAENPQQGLGAIILRVTTARNDPTIAAFQQAKVDIGSPKTQLSVDGIPIDLSPVETRAWNTARGQILERFAAPMTQRTFWSKPESRQIAMQDLLAQAGEAADAQLMKSIGAAEIRRRVLESNQKQRQAKAS